MKKICLVLLAAVLTLLCVGACADSYHFADIYMILDVPGDTYTTQLTPENLAANESFIAGLGETVDSMKEKFTQQGIRLIAYDTTHGRTLVVTAVQDAQSRELYDINEQTADTRASYRANHSNGTYCGAPRPVAAHHPQWLHHHAGYAGGRPPGVGGRYHRHE